MEGRQDDNAINKHNARDNDHDRRPGSVHRFRRSKFGYRDFVDDRVRDGIGRIRRWLDDFIAAGPFDTLDSIGSSTPGYNAVFNDLGFHTHDVVDGLSRGSASLNNDGFQANNFVNGADFTVYGFNPGTSSVTQSGFALDFTNVNGSNFVVAFNGLSASQLASDLSHATTNPGAHQWTMPS